MKRIFLLALFAIVMAVPAMRANVMYVGDLNGDGSVDGGDVSIILEQVLSGGASADCDLNGDGSVDGGDVSILLEVVLGGDPKVKVEIITYTVKGVDFNMVKIPSGTFTMGGTSNSDEKPQHEVTLGEYQIGQTEVTQELWYAVMGSNPSHVIGDDSVPVDRVSWDKCQEFIAELNTITGKNFRLPTEAEWEYAARGGQSGGTTYSGSDDINSVAWYYGNSGDSHSVAQKKPNSLGIYDMSGNVSEWCQDWYGSYSSGAQTNPTGPATGMNRVLRGGNWNSIANDCRVSYRDYDLPNNATSVYGLRLALDDRTRFTVDGVTFEMIDVPGGTFTMGGTSEQGSNAAVDEKPVHEVTLSDYQIGQMEVTQALWKAVMGSNPSSHIGDNLPVENVSWEDCRTFISKLNEKTGKAFRLPTEAEWEYAARGGQSGGTTYSGSNTLGDVAWFYFNTEQPQPVGTKQANRLGIYDMSGNVGEWCSDWYGDYSSEAQTDPQGPTTGTSHVFRGGGWNEFATRCRVSYRNYDKPTYTANNLGLRLALKPIKTSVHTYKVKGISFDMVQLPAGTFTMGSTANGDEKPTHEVTLGEFQIGQTEVTQELWQAVMGSNPSANIGYTWPVDNVSWEDCQEFIAKLNKLTGKGFRLPTEAEWEYAARGCVSGGFTYAGSNDIDDVAWYYSNSGNFSNKVATKKPNSVGLYDMSGNVSEWCQDWRGSYSSEAQTNPTGSATGYSRVLRGGNWYSSASECRVSYRDYDQPSNNSTTYGLRLALDNTVTYSVNGVSFKMVNVPAGTFTMGATAEQGSDAKSRELPTHEVTLSAYQIGQTEVTQALWKAVMGSNPSYHSGDDNLPVEDVSWNDCQTFVDKLSKLTGKSFRLPTEAEWEYAARGGKSGGTKYAGSDNIDDVAWYKNNSSDVIHPVAMKQPNALGLYDMSGNVSEWCGDWGGDYSSQSQTDPQGPDTGEYRVRRGGSEGSEQKECRVSNRDYNSPSHRDIVSGLRLAADITETFTANGVTFSMVKVRGGTFTMGGTDEQPSGSVQDVELPAHDVTLSSFSIGQTEVTQALWKAVMGINPSDNRGDDLPVENVNWDDCQGFIAKLNQITGETFRLPTEAEWEYAARGGKSGGTVFSGSDYVDEVAWYWDNTDKTQPVATKAANGLGIYDMSGNVCELCFDRFSSYPSSPQTNPQGPSLGSYRSLRGGSWDNSAWYSRVSWRGGMDPSERDGLIGLRLAR